MSRPGVYFACARNAFATALAAAVIVAGVPAVALAAPPKPVDATDTNAKGKPAETPENTGRPAVPPGPEIVSKRTPGTKTFATGTPGKYLTKAWSGPVHYRDSQGRLQDIKAGIVDLAPGRVGANRVLLPANLAVNGADPTLVKVTAAPGKTAAFGLSGARNVKGVYAGSTMRYRGILPGVTLQVDVLAGGLKETIVVESRDAQRTFLFPLTLHGMRAEVDHYGNVLFLNDADDIVLRTAHGWMEDSNVDPRVGEGKHSEGVTYRLVPHRGGTALEVSLDQAWMDDPERVYPVKVDPSFHPQNTQADDMFVQQPYTNDYSGLTELKVGTFNGGTDKARSFLHFDGLNFLDGKVIDDTIFWLSAFHSWSCTESETRLHRITGWWSGYGIRSFNSAPPWGDFAGSATFRSRPECGAGWIGWNVRQTMQNWADNVWENYGLMVISPNENDNNSWKKFYSWNQGGDAYGAPTPHLDIWYHDPNSPPYVPDNLAPCGGWTGTSAPTLQARYMDPNGGTGNVDFLAGGVFQPIGASHGQTVYWTPPLGDGNWSWQARAWDGQYHSSYSSPCYFTIDGTAPGAPSVSSSTHPSETAWYANRTATFSWSASDTAPINGYSRVFDTVSGTTPDTVSEGTATSASYTAPADGAYWLHVRARNGTNLWGAAGQRKIQVDITAPTAPTTVTSSSHAVAVPSGDRTVDVAWSGAIDATSGIQGYATAFNASQSTPAGTSVTTTSASTTSAALADGTWWFHVRTVDRAGNVSGDTAYGPFVVDGTGPSAPVITSATHSQTQWSSNRTASFAWPPPADANPISGYSVVFDSSPFTDPDTVPDSGAAAGTWTQSNIGDGTWYLHVRAVDTLGNWGATGHYTVKVDGTNPAAPDVTSSTHPVETSWYSRRDATFNWSGPSDLSGIDGYSYSFNQTATSTPDTTAEPAGTSASFLATSDGLWYFHVRARNGAGLWGTTKHFRIQIDTVGGTPPLTITATSGHAPHFPSSRKPITVQWTPGADVPAGVSGYATEWNNLESDEAGNTQTTTGLTSSSGGVNDGTWWFHVKTIDTAGNASADKAYGPFYIDSNATADPLFLASTLLPDLVAQSDEIGLEQFQPFRSTSLGGPGTAYVHLRTGNLVAQFDDGSIPGLGLNTVVRHTYNSRRTDSLQHDNGLGLGWSLSVGDLEAGLEGALDTADGALSDIDPQSAITAAIPHAATAIGYVLEFTDGDGTTHRFVRRGGPGSRWDSPPGVSLKVREDYGGGTPTVVPLAYEFIRPDGVIYRAENVKTTFGLPYTTWRVVRVSDRRGNALTYGYTNLSGTLRLSSVTSNRASVGTVATLTHDATSKLLTRITLLPGVSETEPATGTTRSWTRTIDFGYSSGRLSSVTENSHTTAANGMRTTSLGYDTSGRLSTVTDPRGKATTITHVNAADGARVQSVRDRRLKTWTYAFGTPDVNGEQATTITSPLSNTTTYRTSARAAIDAQDRRIAGGNIIRITDAGNDTGPVITNFTWSENRLATETDGLGNTRSFKYNDLGLVREVTEPAPNSATAPGLPAGSATAPVVSVLTYQYPASYRYGSSYCTDPSPGTQTVNDEGLCYFVGELTRTSFAENYGNTIRRLTDFTYDGSGNLSTVTQRANGSGSADPANDRTTTFTYYSRGSLRTINGPRTDVTDVTTFGNTADATYGGYDRTGLATTLTDADGKSKTFDYTPYGVVGSSTDRDGRTTKTLYDERDNAKEVTDAEGETTKYSYDANDWRTTETSARLKVTTTDYDDTGNVVTVTKPLGTVISKTYNDDGTLATETNPLGGVTEHFYYPNESLRRTLAPTAVSAGGKGETELLYDLAGRVRRTVSPITNALGARPAVDITYTPAGAVASRSETSPIAAQPSVTRMYFSAHGEVVQATGPRSVGTETATKTDTFNTFGEVTLSRRLAGGGRWIDSSFEYDRAGNQTATTQATGNGGQLRSEYTFDALGRISGQPVDPVNPGHQVTYAYTGEGQQRLRIDTVNNGAPFRTTTTTFNPDNTQQMQVTRNDVTGETLATCNFAAGAAPSTGFDADGNLLLTRAVKNTSDCTGGTLLREQTFSYDDRNWMTGTTQSVRSPQSGAMISRTQSFTYKADGNKETATHDGRTTTYSYSDAGWLESMTDWRGRVSSTTFFPSGAPKTQTLGVPSGGTDVADAAFAYHDDGSMSSLVWRAGTANTTVRSHTAMTYDNGGLRLSEVVQLLQPTVRTNLTATNNPGTATFTHDLLDRLTGWKSPFPADGGGAPTTTYTLDDGGNITREEVRDGTTLKTATISTYPNGRLATRRVETYRANGNVQTAVNDAMSYDGVGQETLRTSNQVTGPGGNIELAKKATSYGPSGYTALADDQRTVSQDPVNDPITDVAYVYDTADRLLSRSQTRTTGTEHTLYFYWGSGGNLAEETDGAGAMKVRYLADEDGEAIAQEKPSGTPSGWTWLLTDTAGNTGTQVDDNGAVTEQAAYDPYGRQDKGGTSKGEKEPSKSTLGFQGAITDPATGSVVLGARQYDPTTARFTTADTFVASSLDMELGTDSLTGNRYLFAAANPTAFYEDGHWPSMPKFVKKIAKKALPALSFVPVVGTAIDVVSAATGRDLLNGGKKLSGAERLMLLGGAALDMATGGTGGKMLKLARKAGEVVNEAKTLRAAAKAARAADEAGEAASSRVVIGETMGRVEKVADKLGAGIYKGRENRNEKSKLLMKIRDLKDNFQWLAGEMKKGTEIVNIGIDGRRLPKGPLGIRRSGPFRMERWVLKIFGYPTQGVPPTWRGRMM